MNIFDDLSPSEKLQLVEDLWDDLAGTPSLCPFTNGKRQRLPGARRTCRAGRRPAFPGKKSNNAFGAGMAVNLVLGEEAEKDLDEAYAWYERQRASLGEEFLSSVDACLHHICRTPTAQPIVFENFRRALVRRFPYAVFYEHADEIVAVYGVIHSAARSEQMAGAIVVARDACADLDEERFRLFFFSFAT